MSKHRETAWFSHSIACRKFIWNYGWSVSLKLWDTAQSAQKWRLLSKQWIPKNLGLREPKVRQTFHIPIHCFLLYLLSCELHYLFCCLERRQQLKKSGKIRKCCTYRKAPKNLNSIQSCSFYNIYLNRYIIKRCGMENHTFWRYIVGILGISVKLW